jgi:hypothetical protein
MGEGTGHNDRHSLLQFEEVAMYIPVRKSLGSILSVIALLGPLNAKGQAQLRPGTVNPMLLNPALNPALRLSFNPYVNPFAASALVGPQNVLASPGYGFGLNRGGNFGALSGASSPFSQLGYGSLLNGGGSGIYGGSGSLASSLLSGAASGAGYSYGSYTQWMMNPYQGYLEGAGDLTRTNAQYWQTIQQARMTRQEAIRSSLDTRRAMIEEAEWERAHMPDPEKIRQQALQRELNRARVSPPLNDVWSARALNALLRHLITLQGNGVRGPDVPLNEDIVNHLNVKAGDSTGNVGLLKNNGDLEWPESLLGRAFKDGRERINSQICTAYKSVASGNNPDAATLNDLLAQVRKMRAKLKDNVGDLKPDEYIEARRYVDELGQTLSALQDPNIGKQFNGDWRPKVRDVAQLVKHMREKGLMFAPATEKDQAAYVALYHALAAFDASLGRVVHDARGNLDGGDNK